MRKKSISFTRRSLREFSQAMAAPPGAPFCFTRSGTPAPTAAAACGSSIPGAKHETMLAPDTRPKVANDET
ncbi:hypothetical protein EVAR_87012_1 [Eumeta japonica]|uniref:Uncharacterized protein n=1 Tax=Eumeta variegata TaxID=151549 RepID=A0A4C1W5Y5_EUMVA|nr:hypothetical protein EVAR_87012_1 [Eumeta japonica]